ncbi:MULTISPECIES: YbaB/EbfC family nucleoid-associated protein [Legionella]|uniref:YbaB/EbfC family nucleoid-associated protein n=1 Tax=Legionella resiliens TaxID=2905958 RepID=A0ABS8X5A1_9GAMM|nr:MULTISPECIES: YbaB/EbfC family nucleoid-associated protein [unclassified Legionella]MCE0723165.1 YbaB/EbfC family nucleoid-associated protein [Legionella sp. 9fVS26]MCE3532318.1 YbaB/EbfC family nucleoid-associated protein [Legionella sp. 8cVS16]QLZ68449.1 Nucleoid-associated protein YbaB [Legionella sp. PC1000]
MKSARTFTVDENILKALGADTLKTIRVKGIQMEAEIAAKLEELESLVVQGISSGGYAKAEVDGKHQILGLSFDPGYSEMDNRTKTCLLMTEAINDAIYKVNLTIEKEISTIKYKYTGEVIKNFNLNNE